jgi:hypothetical protein
MLSVNEPDLKVVMSKITRRKALKNLRRRAPSISVWRSEEIIRELFPAKSCARDERESSESQRDLDSNWEFVHTAPLAQEALNLLEMLIDITHESEDREQITGFQGKIGHKPASPLELKSTALVIGMVSSSE